MNSITAVADRIRAEVEMGDHCLANILARLDDDIARINERKQQITEEFAARRRSLLDVLGEPVTPTQHEEEIPNE